MQLCFGGDLFAGPPVCDSNSVNEWPWRHPQMWADVLLRHSLGAFLTLQSLEESLLVHACLRATLNRKMGMWCSFLITTRQVDYCKNVCVCVHFFFFKSISRPTVVFCVFFMFSMELLKYYYASDTTTNDWGWSPPTHTLQCMHILSYLQSYSSLRKHRV